MGESAARSTFGIRRRIGGTVAAASALGIGLTLAGGLSASATNLGTTSGNRSSGCAVNWVARTIMDRDGVPGLDRDLQGKPVDYSNGGYVHDISKAAFGDPGFMEIQHWIGNPGDPTSIHWRLPVATDRDIKDAKLVLTLPADHGYALSTDDLATWIGRWETTHTYGNIPASKISVSGRTVSVDLGDLKAGTGVIFQVTGHVAPDAVDDTFQADATLTGTYVQGDGCAVGLPPVPSPPVEGPCDQVLTGRTVMPEPAADITVRDKAGDGGETNADGWGQGATRTLRLYGATDRDLTNVTYTATAAQGMTFTSVDDAVASPANGQLPNNGYTGVVSGASAPVRSADGTKITVTIARMPKGSAFSFNAVATLDGSGKAIVVDHVMSGSYPECTPGAPAPVVRVDTAEGTLDCAGKTVSTTTTTTTIPWVFDAAKGTWVPGTATRVVTHGSRPATPAEVATCQAPPVTPPTQPTPPPVIPPRPTAPPAVPVTPAPAPTAPGTPRPVPPGQDHPAPKPVEPGTPVKPVKPVKYVTRVFQVDRYVPRTAAQARLVARLDDDGVLRYREDRPMWGHNTWQFVTVRVPSNATNDQVAAAINAKTTKAVGDLRTPARLASAKAGRGYTIAWELGRGAKPTTKLAWGPKNDVSQRFFGRS